MRTLCDVRPDVASIASMVKKMLAALGEASHGLRLQRREG